MSRMNWITSSSIGPMLFASGERDVEEPAGLTYEERKAWEKEHPFPTLAILLIGTLGDGFCPIAFEGVNGWWNAITKGERVELAPRDEDSRRHGLALSLAVARSEEYARDWMQSKERTESWRCAERRWRPPTSEKLDRCELAYKHDGPHIAKGVTWENRKP